MALAIASGGAFACGGPTAAKRSPTSLEPPSCGAAPAVTESWKHGFSSRATAKLGSPRHGASDSLTVVGQAASLEARFQYGKTLKDLDDEIVSLWIADPTCKWRALGDTLTDEDGVARFEVGSSSVKDPGLFVFEMVVGGDLSRARGYLWVVPPSSRVVVFDIDGTLTTDDDEVIGELLLGRTPEELPGASAVVRKYANAGVLPIYITGRPMVLSDRSRRWLSSFGYPPGPLALTRGYRQGVRRVQEFKTAAIVRIKQALDLDIVAAYGNATTDVCAYANSGIDSMDTFIIGRNGGAACDGKPATVPLVDYRAHLETLLIPPPND